MKEIFNSTKRICVFSILAFMFFGILDALVVDKIASAILDIFGDVFIFTFGYFLCLKHQIDLFK